MNGIDSATAVSCSSSNTAGWSVGPRWMTAPLPSSCLPTRLGSTPGAIACVTSTASATAGLSANAVVCAPPSVVSSCAAATAATAPDAPPASATRRAASSAT